MKSIGQGRLRDIETVVKILFNATETLEKTKAIKELDLNPIIVYGKDKKGSSWCENIS